MFAKTTLGVMIFNEDPDADSDDWVTIETLIQNTKQNTLNGGKNDYQNI